MNTNMLLYHKRNFFMRGILSLLLIYLSSGITLADILDANDNQTCETTTADNTSCFNDSTDDASTARTDAPIGGDTDMLTGSTDDASTAGTDASTDVEPAPCEPATYSNETRQVDLPYVEVPLYTDIDGKSILFTGIFSAILEIPFGFSDIQVKELTFIETIEQTNSCHAKFDPENGLLTIPILNVPTIIPSLTNNPISGPEVQCDATLQQSVLRPDVLSLIEFNCKLP